MMKMKFMIYDSMYTSVDDEVRETISKLFYCTDDTHVPLAPMQKQDAASNNCGVLAIAIATAIINPSLLHFKEKEMRKHLCDCFENGTISLFPCYDV